MDLIRSANYFFTFIFSLDLILIVSTFTSEMVIGNKIYALEWIIAYGTLFVIIPVSILFIAFQGFIIIKRKALIDKDKFNFINIILFLSVIIVTISYSLFAKA